MKYPEYTNSQIAEIIDEHIHSARDRAMLKRRYIDGLHYEQIAEEFDLSVQHTKTLIYRNQQKIFKHL